MKKFKSLVAALLMSATATFAQVPQGFSYQAVVRDAQNAVVANQTVEVTLTILQGATADAATAVFSEKHSAKTNANGLFSLTVGSVDADNFSKIDWAAGNVFLKTESQYGTATTQLLSVPFALYAAKANVDLSGYALKSEIPAMPDLSGYVQKTDIPTVPTKVSDFENDANYLTAHQDISGKLDASVAEETYAKKTDTETELAELKAFVKKYGTSLAIFNGEVVDLGLTSGTLWATCNLGASTPTENGDYYAWGETEPKSDYSWETYKHCNGDWRSITKYCNDESYGNDGFTDALTTLESIDDAATIVLDDNWATPTYEQWDELRNQCEWERTDDYKASGKNGYIVYKKVNGAEAQSHVYSTDTDPHIFLPVANGIGPHLNAGNGFYWSSTLGQSYPENACFFSFSNSESNLSNWGTNRSNGLSVRPVRHK